MHKAMRSYCGLIIFLFFNPILWKCFLPKTVCPSTRDSEYICAIKTTRDLIGFNIILSELGFRSPTPPLLFTDSEAAEKTAKSDHLHSDSRWMGIRIAWLRQCIQDLLVNIVWRSGTEQLADIMTKVLPATDYNTLRTLLMNLRYLELDGWTPAKLLK